METEIEISPYGREKISDYEVKYRTTVGVNLQRNLWESALINAGRVRFTVEVSGQSSDEDQVVLITSMDSSVLIEELEDIIFS